MARILRVFAALPTPCSPRAAEAIERDPRATAVPIGQYHHEARAAFERLLWLNPEDHQGARFALAKILAGSPWSAD